MLIPINEVYLSYRLDVQVEPNWEKISRWYFPEIKKDENPFTYVNEFVKKNNVDKEESLYLKFFRFKMFHDDVSGMETIWSDDYKTFLNDPEIQGAFLRNEKDDIELTSKEDTSMRISPVHIKTTLVNGPMGGEVLSSIPFGQILDLLIRIQQETGCADREIRMFPKDLAELFRDDNVSYKSIENIHASDKSNQIDISKTTEEFQESGIELNDKRVDSHVFETPYFSISISAEFFYPKII